MMTSELAWTNPFSKLLEEYQKCFPKDRLSAIALSACWKEFEKLAKVWVRLCSDFQIEIKSREIFGKLFDGEQLNEMELKIKESYKTEHWYLEIDYENFIYQATRVMDRTSYCVRFFFNDIVNQEFGNHKTFIEDYKNSMEQRDKEYTIYILNNTDWYDELKTTRDSFVAHGRPYIFVSCISDNGHVQVAYRVETQTKEHHLKKIRELANKYKEMYYLQSDQIWEENLSTLIAIKKYLDVNDQQTFEQSFKEIGAELPDAYELANGIIDFCNFYVEHFMPMVKQIH